jgi:predicted Zn-ribbon and HTH transcriptional regulator
MPRKNKKEFIMTWELTCRQCKFNFEVPVPRGPREEKELKCPKCESKYIERIETLSEGVAPPCGG